MKLLVERAGEIINKQEFFETVWKKAFVEDNSLTVTMTALRKALGDNPKEPKFIVNLPRKGYRFIADVKIIEIVPPLIQAEKIYEAVLLSAQTEKREITPTLKKDRETNLKNRKTLGAIFAVCLLIFTFVLGFRYFGHSRADAATVVNQPNVASIAVLPFENPNADTEYLSDGLTEGIASDLTALLDLTKKKRCSPKPSPRGEITAFWKAKVRCR